MNQVVPPRFLFRWSFIAPRITNIPRTTGRLLELPDECVLPSLGEFDSRVDFARIKCAWNDDGFGISLDIAGRAKGPQCDKNNLMGSDGIQVWIDTRDTKTVHRATKFCHQFILLPSGGGAKKRDAIVRSLPFTRTREDATLPNSDLVRVQSDVSESYWLDAWFPAELLTGFEPSTNPRIGFHYVVRDSVFGEQTLAVGSEFPYESDPSLWQTVELAP